ncbi:MAG: short-chain dehydrogenase/reductase [Solirubrobacteraceae bacterium]
MRPSRRPRFLAPAALAATAGVAGASFAAVRRGVGGGAASGASTGGTAHVTGAAHDRSPSERAAPVAGAGRPWTDRTALVTGAAAGIGAEVARALHARGATVVLVDREGAAAEAAADVLGDRAVAVTADVTDGAAMADAVRHAVALHDRLDVVVANAGIAPPFTTLRSIDPATFERVVEVDLLGVWRTVAPALEPIVASAGQVVVVSSVYAWMNGAATAPYAVAKAAIEQLGRALRVELAPYGASATVAHFGFVDTGLVRDALHDPVARALTERAPAFLSRPIAVDVAAERLVRAVERRAPRLVLPRWWAPVAVLRGVLGPLGDHWMAADPALREILRRADDAAEGPAGSRVVAGA